MLTPLHGNLNIYICWKISGNYSNNSFVIDDMIAVLHVVYVYMYYMYICPVDNICLYVHHSIISQPNWLKFYKHLENNMQFHPRT